ncbi:MAG: DUF3800 domain-containing protein [Methanocellales archaeon]|nr:DUF3800 domain-containing protein [Methanocellales archaeon]
MQVYIDESGQTGEVAPNVLDNQPYFTLAGLGVLEDQENSIEEKVKQLKEKHGITKIELTSKVVYPKYPNFMLDLFVFLNDLDCPLFVEMMDKKYYLSMNIADIIYPAMEGFMEVPKDLEDYLVEIRPIAADYIYNNASKEVYTSFHIACEMQTKESFEKFLFGFVGELKKKKDNIGQRLYKDAMVTVQIYQKHLESEPFSDANWTIHLPLFRDEKDKEVSLLPNIQALSNLCARAEQYREDMKLPAVRFIHDEQHIYKDILEHIIQRLKELDSYKGVNLNTYRSKFHLQKQTDIRFSKSSDSTCIQIADLMAGLINRVWAQFMREDIIQKEYAIIIDTLNSYHQVYHKSIGINYVVEGSQLESFTEHIKYQAMH